MKKFNVGDRVRVLGDIDLGSNWAVKKGTIAIFVQQTGVELCKIKTEGSFPNTVTTFNGNLELITKDKPLIRWVKNLEGRMLLLNERFVLETTGIYLDFDSNLARFLVNTANIKPGVYDEELTERELVLLSVPGRVEGLGELKEICRASRYRQEENRTEFIIYNQAAEELKSLFR